jgi:uncharacterized membrane protein YkvA (DUF1232 family)
MKVFRSIREAAKRIKHDSMTVYFVARDPRTPLLVKLLALTIAAYALSPIDLIPDFIPIFGYVDDLIILPLGILLVIKLTPDEVIDASRTKVNEISAKPTNKVAAIVIVAIWLLCTVGIGYWVWGSYTPNHLLWRRSP